MHVFSVAAESLWSAILMAIRKRREITLANVSESSRGFCRLHR
jgi:hypothetical protein